MFTGSEIMANISLMNRYGDDDYAYNYYLHNLGYKDTMAMHDLLTVKRNTDKSKSTEYNNINRDLTKSISELDQWQKSIGGYIKDLERKLRDIDRNNPNNSEDYNETMKNISEMKKKELDAIMGKMNGKKIKYDLLQKQFKADNDTGAGNNNNGNPQNNNPLVRSAYTLQSLSRGSAGTDQAPMVSNEDRASLVTGGFSSDAIVKPAHIQEELDKVEFDDYSILATQYGPEAIKETYKCNPSTGYGFVEYVGPNGETGTRDLPINTFASSKVNWGNRTVTTAGGQTYNIEEYDGDVPNKAEWDRLFDGANTLGQKR